MGASDHRCALHGNDIYEDTARHEGANKCRVESLRVSSSSVFPPQTATSRLEGNREPTESGATSTATHEPTWIERMALRLARQLEMYFWRMRHSAEDDLPISSID